MSELLPNERLKEIQELLRDYRQLDGKLTRLRKALEQIRDEEPVIGEMGPSFSFSGHIKKLRGLAAGALAPQ